MIEEYLRYEKQYGRAIALPFFAGLLRSRGIYNMRSREISVFMHYLKSWDADWELFWNLLFLS